MGDEGIFATTAEVQRKVGANVSATSNVEAFINQYITEAESEINTICRFNFSDNYAALNADVKGLLKKAASNLAATNVIAYDTQGMSVAVATLRINFLWAEYQEAIRELKKKENQTFINAA